MSKASAEPTLELLRRVTDWEWTIGLDAALLQDQFYTGTLLSVPVSGSELAAHRTALRHFVASRDLSRDGLTVLTAVQLKLERAFDDSDDGSDRRTVDLDATEVIVLAIANLGIAHHYRSRRDRSEATLHRLLGGQLLERVEDSPAVPDGFDENGTSALLPGSNPSAG
jgi:hypothetical protein